MADAPDRQGRHGVDMVETVSRTLLSRLRLGDGVMEETSLGREADFALPVGIVTLLLADIEGSTRLWESRAAEMTSAIADFDQLVSETVGRRRGVRPVEQGEGDSFVAAFSRPSDAVACALDLQLALSERDGPIRLRIGLHTGEVQLRDEGNYVGRTVTRCARLRDVAHGGQTVLSQSTADLVVDGLPEGTWLIDLGSHRLKDLARPEHVWQLGHAGLQTTFAALRSLDAHPHNLPVQRTSFIGRTAELTDLRHLLAESNLVTIFGSGGCGKTRLAQQVAADRLDAYPDGVWLVELAPMADASLVPAAVATALSVKEESFRTLTETVVDHLGAKRVLLVLDNCEHVLPAAADLAEALLRGCPGVTLLATSRERLGVEGETAWRVPNLPVPNQDTPSSVESLAAYDAVQLFVDRAVRARPNFAVTNDNAAAVAQICQRLDGIPLAIELAAARVRVLTAEQICDGLSDRFRLLTGGARTLVPRQQTLEASVEWSFDLLSDAERSVLRRLSVFAGGFTLDGAEAVVVGDDIERSTVLDLLTSLADKSLVLMAEEGRAARYDLLETVRQYGLDRLADAGEEAATRARHQAFYVDLADRAERDLRGPRERDRYLLFDVEYDNLRAALRASLEEGDGESGMRLVGALGKYWYARSHGSEGVSWGDAVFVLGAEVDATVRARAMLGRAWPHFAVGGLAALQELAKDAVDLSRAIADRSVLANALALYGNALSFRDPRAAGPVLDEAVVVARETGEVYALALALVYAGCCHGWTDGGPLEDRLLDEAIELCRLHGEDECLAEALTWRSFAAVFSGDYPLAEACAEEAGTLARHVGSFWAAQQSQVALAVARRRQGHDEAARQLIEDVAAAFRRVAPEVAEFMAGFEALIALESGRITDGTRFADAAVAHSHAQGGVVYAPLALSIRGLLSCAAGDLTGATASCREALEYAERSGVRWLDGWALEGLGRVARAEGDLRASAARHHEALAHGHRVGDRPGVATALDALGGLATLDGDAVHAARLFGAAQAICDALGHVRPAPWRAEYEDDVATARDAVSSEEFDAAWAEGAALAIDEAVAYATRGRGERGRPSTGWASLTPAELDVVRLVAEGLTNPQVGERLFISRRTVQTHLAHVFAKLGISTRHELTKLAGQRGR